MQTNYIYVQRRMYIQYLVSEISKSNSQFYNISLCASKRIKVHLYASAVTCRLLLCACEPVNRESLTREKEDCAGLRKDAREIRSYCQVQGLGDATTRCATPIVRLRLRLHFQITVRADNIERDKSLSRGMVRRGIQSKYLSLGALFLAKTVEYCKA